MDDEVQSLVVNRNCQLDLYRYHGCQPWHGNRYWGYRLQIPQGDNLVIKEIEDTYEPLKYFNKNIRCVWCKCWN